MSRRPNYNFPCPECGEEHGLIWHPREGVGWYCHACDTMFGGLPDMHDLVEKIRYVEALWPFVDTDALPESVVDALEALFEATKDAKVLEALGTTTGARKPTRTRQPKGPSHAGIR